MLRGRVLSRVLQSPRLLLRPAARAAATPRPLSGLISAVRPWSHPFSTKVGAAEGAAEPAPTMASGGPAIRDAPREDAFLLLESPTYSRFVNMMMKSGKKQTARKLLWQTMVNIRDAGHDPQEVFFTALDNARPMMEMRSFRAGPVPFPLAPRRAEGQAMKWIVQAARKRGGRGGKPFDQKLTQELLDAYQLKGGAVAKREAVHRDAVINQAAAHFRWRAGNDNLPAGSVDLDRKSYRPVGRRTVKRLQGAMMAPTAAPR